MKRHPSCAITFTVNIATFMSLLAVLPVNATSPSTAELAKAQTQQQKIDNIALEAKLARVNCESGLLKHNENCIDTDNKTTLDWSFTPSYRNYYPLYMLPEYVDCAALDELAGLSETERKNKATQLRAEKGLTTLPKDSKFRQTLNESSQTEKEMVVHIYEVPNTKSISNKTTITETFFDQPYKLCKEKISNSRYKRIGGLNTGLLVVPFKFRSGDIYSDSSIGPYLSYKFERLEFIGLLGLAQVSVSEVGTKDVTSEQGITYALGLSLEVAKDWDVAFLVGADHLSGSVGDEWKYQDDPWLSFAIGFNFTR